MRLLLVAGGALLLIWLVGLAVVSPVGEVVSSVRCARASERLSLANAAPPINPVFEAQNRQERIEAGRLAELYCVR